MRLRIFFLGEGEVEGGLSSDVLCLFGFTFFFHSQRRGGERLPNQLVFFLKPHKQGGSKFVVVDVLDDDVVSVVLVVLAVVVVAIGIVVLEVIPGNLFSLKKIKKEFVGG